jgi:transcriptional regulator with XRE-family HTH domain
MIWIKTLCKQTGMSQADLASFLNISRSAVAMAVAGERNLPDDALLKLATLKLAVEEPLVVTNNKEGKSGSPWALAKQAQLQLHATWLAAKAGRLEKHLASLQKKLGQRQQMQQLLAGMGRLQQRKKTTAKEIRLLQSLGKQYHPGRQEQGLQDRIIKGRLKIAAMQAEAKAAAELAASFGQPNP